MRESYKAITWENRLTVARSFLSLENVKDHIAFTKEMLP